MKNPVISIRSGLKAVAVTAFACLVFGPTVKAQSKEGKEVFTTVEVTPTYPGGIDGFYRFLAKTIIYPAEARDKNIQGRTIATFIVERDGALSNVRVLRSPDSSLSQETRRVLALSPKWNPGMQNGKTVRVQYTVPVVYSIAGSRKLPADTAMNKALIVVDGKVTTRAEMDKIKPADIKSVNVIKGKAATDKYGDKAVHGVVEVTTKP